MDARTIWSAEPQPRTDPELLARAAAVRAAGFELSAGMWYECYMRSTHSAEFVDALRAIQSPPATEHPWR